MHEYIFLAGGAGWQIFDLSFVLRFSIARDDVMLVLFIDAGRRKGDGVSQLLSRRVASGLDAYDQRLQLSGKIWGINNRRAITVLFAQFSRQQFPYLLST